VIVAETDPTWTWVALEVLCVGLLMITGTLWQRGRARTAAPEVVARYRASTWSLAVLAVIGAIRLLAHAY